MKIEFTRCHGSGNVFALVGHPEHAFSLAEDQLPNLAIQLCHEKYTDSDGLLIVQKDDAHNVDARMRMFNPDGTEAEICGNGLRCVARETMDVLGKDIVNISTKTRVYPAHKQKIFKNDVYTVSVEMGKANFDPEQIPAQINMETEKFLDRILPDLSDTLRVSILGMPNPHIVAFVDDAIFPVKQLIKMGERVNNPQTKTFPRGSNVNFVKKLGENAFFVQTYERGAGLTSSCGSGMTASSIVACLLGHAAFDKPITIYNQGGYVKTCVNNMTESAVLTGNATYLSKANIEYDTDAGAMSDAFDEILYTSEAEQYLDIVQQKNAKLEQLGFSSEIVSLGKKTELLHKSSKI